MNSERPRSKANLYSLRFATFLGSGYNDSGRRKNGELKLNQGLHINTEKREKIKLAGLRRTDKKPVLSLNDLNTPCGRRMTGKLHRRGRKSRWIGWEKNDWDRLSLESEGKVLYRVRPRITFNGKVKRGTSTMALAGGINLTFKK